MMASEYRGESACGLSWASQPLERWNAVCSLAPGRLGEHVDVGVAPDPLSTAVNNATAGNRFQDLHSDSPTGFVETNVPDAPQPLVSTRQAPGDP